MFGLFPQLLFSDPEPRPPDRARTSGHSTLLRQQHVPHLRWHGHDSHFLVPPLRPRRLSDLRPLHLLQARCWHAVVFSVLVTVDRKQRYLLGQPPCKPAVRLSGGLHVAEVPCQPPCLATHRLRARCRRRHRCLLRGRRASVARTLGQPCCGGGLRRAAWAGCSGPPGQHRRARAPVPWLHLRAGGGDARRPHVRRVGARAGQHTGSSAGIDSAAPEGAAAMLRPDCARDAGHGVEQRLRPDVLLAGR